VLMTSSCRMGCQAAIAPGRRFSLNPHHSAKGQRLVCVSSSPRRSTRAASRSTHSTTSHTGQSRPKALFAEAMRAMSRQALRHRQDESGDRIVRAIPSLRL